MDKTKKLLLLRLNIPSTILGHKYLAYALRLCMHDDSYLTSVYKSLYVEVARHYKTTRCNVEHCIRTAIQHCWDHGDTALLSEIALYPLTDKPTNSEFIDILYNHLAG